MLIIFGRECLTYVAEITEPRLRGILASTSGIAVIGGILTQFTLGTFLHWRTVALVSCFVPITSTALLFLLPESPHWLMQKNRLDEAHKSLAWFRGWSTLEDVQPEFRELCEQMGKTADSQVEELTFGQFAKLFAQKSFLWPYLVVIFTFFMSHFSGTSPLQVYAVKIFSSLNSPIDEYYATVLMGVSEMLGCIVSSCIVHVTGKRIINFISLIGCGTCFLTVASYSYANNLNYFHASTHGTGENNGAWLPMTLLIVSTFFTHVGIKLLPWMLIGEVYSNETRSMASGFSGATSYIFGFIVNKTFPQLVASIKLSGAFWFYASMSFAGAIVLYFILPETEGKTLFEITEHFAGNSKIDNKVTRHGKKKKMKEGKENKGYDVDAESRL